MNNEAGRAFTKIAYSVSVKAVQEKLESRDFNARIETMGQPRNTLDENLREFIALRNSFYLGTASKGGEPYIQHRGGDRGFIDVIDERTLRIPDYPGNKQYITLGNLAENPRAFIFMIDYEMKSRVKFWGKAEVEDITGDNRAILFHIEAWDINCSKHLPDYFSMETVRQATARLNKRIEELEAELSELKGDQ